MACFENPENKNKVEDRKVDRKKEVRKQGWEGTKPSKWRIRKFHGKTPKSHVKVESGKDGKL